MLVVGLGIGIFFVLRYADRVKADPSRSVVADLREENARRFSVEAGRDRRPDRHQKVILVVFGLAFVVMMYGVIPWEDLGVGRADAVVVVPRDDGVVHPVQHRHRADRRAVGGDLTSAFVDGARDLLGVALIIGIARGITVVMNNGQITDTVLHWAEQALGDVGQAGFAVVMFALFLPCRS